MNEWSSPQVEVAARPEMAITVRGFSLYFFRLYMENLVIEEKCTVILKTNSLS